jgi:nitroreductase
MIKKSFFKKTVRIFFGFLWDNIVYVKHSVTQPHNYLEGQRALGVVARLYHSIEKGLSLDKPRPEFGLSNVSKLISILSKIPSERDKHHYKVAIDVLNNYFRFHDDYETSDQFTFQFHQFQMLQYLEPTNIGGAQAHNIRDHNERLDVLHHLAKRRSVRNFSCEKTVDEGDILKVIEFARNCPSACNRQGIKIFYSSDMAEIEMLLELQNGSRTFRNAVPTLLIITYDIRFLEGVEERNLGYVEGGIWLNSLVTSIHFLGFQSCILNWCVSPKTDALFRKKSRIPASYQIIGLVALGKGKDEQKVPISSKRESIELIQRLEI